MPKTFDKSESALNSSSNRIVRLVWGAVALTIALLAVGYVLTYQSERKTVHASLDQALTVEAKGYAQFVMLSLKIVDRMLRVGRERYFRGEALPMQAAIEGALKELDGLVLQVAVANAEGVVIYSSLGTPNPPVSIADRPHFLAAKGKTEDELFISEPVLGRVSQKLALQLVRPLIAPDGTFAGAIVASVDPERLKNYFTSLDALDGNGRVTIVGADGVVRFRLTEAGFAAGQDLKKTPHWKTISGALKGVYDDVSPVDNVNRRSAFEKVPGLPLTVAVGKGVREAFADFERRWNIILSLSLALAVVLVCIAAAVAKLVKAQQITFRLTEEKRQRALESDQSKSKYLASISHEFRTPLNSILGFSELIRDTCAEPRSSQFAGLIHKSGVHLHALVNTLLDLAKIESGKMALSLESVETQSLLETLVAIHGVSASQKKIGLSLTTDGVLEGTLSTDRTKLVQVLNNVLHNAIKFTNTGAIFVVLKPVGKSGALISVTDTGIGIEAEELEMIFDRFNTVPGHLEGPTEKGSGLGLALCRELLTLMGGTIDVMSELGQGTTVNIFVPYSVTNDEGSA